MAKASSEHETTEQRGPDRQRLLPNQGASPTLRCCLLSGGASQRMGRDKALLPHPEGGTWLSRSLLLLAQIGAPITLLSRWPEHLSLASSLGITALEAWAESPPYEGPLLALHRLMQRHSEERLLLCPVDMPHLTLAALDTLLTVAADQAAVPCVAHDGQRCQPLLGVYPNSAHQGARLDRLIEQGERRLQTWLEQQPLQMVPLDPAAIQNINHSAELGR